jgi:hypothetical protein
MDPHVDPSLSTRELIRALRVRPAGTGLPETAAWHTFHALARRGEADAASLFVDALRADLQRRRAGEALSTVDSAPDDHRLTDDPVLGEMWRAFKKCLVTGRPAPAEALLGEIARRLASRTPTA